MKTTPIQLNSRVHIYSPAHYNKRGRVIGISSHGPLTIRLDSGAEVQVAACDVEAA